MIHCHKREGIGHQPGIEDIFFHKGPLTNQSILEDTRQREEQADTATVTIKTLMK